MVTSKVIITDHDVINKQFSFEYEVGLSSFDLALISINKLTNKSAFSVNNPPITTYLI